MKLNIFQQVLLGSLCVLSVVKCQKWDYGLQGKDWQDPMCKTNDEGSPIDLSGSFSDGSFLKLEMNPNTADLPSIFEFDGNRLFIEGNFASFNLTNTSSGKPASRQYETQRIEFKQPCEHLYQSDGCDLEMQIFAPETKASIKLGGESKRPNLAFVYRFKTIQKQADNFFTVFDLSKVQTLLNGNLYKAMKTSSVLTSKPNIKWSYYPGSLTVPFCDQVVHWFVAQPVFEIQTSQLTHLQTLITKNQTFSGLAKGNARDVQILGKRTIYEGELNLDGFKDQTKAVLKAYQCKYTTDLEKDFTLYGYSHDEEYLISTADCEIRLWNVKAKSQQCMLKDQHTNDVTAFAYGQGQLVSGGKDRKLVIWDTVTCQKKKILYGLTNYPLSVVWSNDFKLVATGDLDNNVIVWDVETGKTKVFQSHDADVTQVQFSKDNSRVYSTDAKGYLKVWDITKQPTDQGSLIKSVKIHKDRINALLLFENLVVTGSDDNIAAVNTLDLDCDLSKLMGHKGPIQTLQHKAQFEFASSSSDLTIKIWEGKKGLVTKSGWIVKNTPYILLNKWSTPCEKETEKNIEGVTKRFKQIDQKRLVQNNKINEFNYQNKFIQTDFM